MYKQLFPTIIIIYLLLLIQGIDSFSQAQSLRTIDRDILESINNIDGAFISGYSEFASVSASVFSIGIPASLFTYSLIKKDFELTQSSVYLGASVVSSFIASWVLKDVFDRNRPYNSHPGRIRPNNIESTYSFPSSHAAVSFGLATSLSLQYPKWYIITPSYFWALSVGFSRIHKGVHYPSDVLAGALVGSFSAYICYELNKWAKNAYMKKRNTHNTGWITSIYP